MYDRTGKLVVCRDTSHEHHRLVVKAHSSSYPNGTLRKLGLLKSGTLINWWMIERGDLFFLPSRRSALVSDTFLSWTQERYSGRRRKSWENGRLVVCLLGGARLVVRIQMFLHRVNDQVRKGRKQTSMDATENSEEHLVIWRMFMSSTLQAFVFMGENYPDKWHSIKNSTISQWNRCSISQKLVCEQSDEIYGVKTIDWEHSSWKYFSLIGDEQVISLQRTKVYVFSDSVLCLSKTHKNAQSNTTWEER